MLHVSPLALVLMCATLAAPTAALATPTVAEILTHPGGEKASAVRRHTAVQVGAMMQLRYGYAPAVDDPATAVNEAAAGAEQGFQLRRGRMRLKILHGNLKLAGGFAFAKGKPRLLSLYLGVPLGRQFDLRLGQSKRLLTHAYLQSSTVQRQIERSPIGDQIGANRDVGVRLRGRFLKRFVTIQLGLFNGNGANTVGNDTGRLLAEGRVDVSLLRRLRLDAPRLGRKLAFAVGGAVARGPIRADRFKSGEQLTRLDTSLAWSMHAAARWQRVLLETEWLWHDRTPEDARTNPSGPLGVAPRREGGWSAQVSWQPPLDRQRWEVSGRVFRWRDARADASSEVQELEGCLTWRLDADRWKLQAAVRRKTRTRAGGAAMVSHRAQLQLQAEL